MSSPLHREIDAPRYRVVVNGRPAYRAESRGATTCPDKVSVRLPRNGSDMPMIWSPWTGFGTAPQSPKWH